MRFSEKTVIVTGASSGIGEATARRFSAEGANVVLVSRTETALQKVAADLDDGRILIQLADVGDENAVTELIDATLERFGQIDVLVNNAGTMVQGDVTEIATNDYRRVMATLVDGVFFGCRAALPHLAKTKGAVVNVDSVSGLGGDWGMSIYNLAKGGIANFTKALALDYGKKGVRVNAVAPTLTRTGMTEDMFADESMINRFIDRIALRRYAQPDDIAAVITFLASEDARFVTGAIVPVDGGLTASNGQPRQA